MKRRGLKVKTGIKAPALIAGKADRRAAGIPGVASGIAMAAMAEVQDAIHENRPTFPAPALPPLTFAARRAARAAAAAMGAFPPRQMPQTIAGRLEWVGKLLNGVPIVDDEGRPTGETSGPLITIEQAANLLDIPALDFATTEAIRRAEGENALIEAVNEASAAADKHGKPNHVFPRAPGGIDAWLRPWVDCPCGSKEHQAAGHPAPMPPIRCVVSPPCERCFYCKVAARGPDWWLS